MTALSLVLGLTVYSGHVPGEPAQSTALFSGTDFTGTSRSAYVGGVWGPFGGLDDAGLRFRGLGSYGQYTYASTLPVPGGNGEFQIRGDVFTAEVMAGHMWRRGEWTVTTYLGAQYVEHVLFPDDASNEINGARWGAKVQGEVWRNIGSRAWVSADASYGSAFGDYWSQGRFGRDLGRRLSIGIEAGVLGNADYGAGRAGLFLQMRRSGTDIRLSGGVTEDYRGDGASSYVSIAVYGRR